MKVEVRCPECGKGYLVDETKIPAGGGVVPCQACGTPIALKARVPTPPPPSPVGTSSTPTVVPTAPPGASSSEVCCPRCGLHFVPSERPDPEPSTRPTVLLVEDMEYFVEIARDALAGRYELKIATTVDEARGVLARGGIDLLLLDLTLEGGQDGLRLLRESPGKICPVLLFTAQDESEMYGEGWSKMRALGIDDVVIKGINMGEILARKVAEMLGQPQEKDSLRR